MERKMRVSARMMAAAFLAAGAPSISAGAVKANAAPATAIVLIAADEDGGEPGGPGAPGTFDDGEAEPHARAPDLPSGNDTPDENEPPDNGFGGCLFDKRPLELVI